MYQEKQKQKQEVCRGFLSSSIHQALVSTGMQGSYLRLGKNRLKRLEWCLVLTQGLE